MCPHDQRDALQVGWASAEGSQGICSQSAGWLILHLSDPCVSGLGTWGRTVEGIWAPQVAEVEARWVVWRSRPESNVRLRCSETRPRTEGTGSQEGAGPLPPRSPLRKLTRIKHKTVYECQKAKHVFFYFWFFLRWTHQISEERAVLSELRGGKKLFRKHWRLSLHWWQQQVQLYWSSVLQCVV